VRAAHGPVEGVIGGAEPFASVRDAVATGRFDEIIVSTKPRRTSKWLRRDLIRRVEGLGLPVTVVTPRGVARESDADKLLAQGTMLGGGG